MNEVGDFTRALSKFLTSESLSILSGILGAIKKDAKIWLSYYREREFGIGRFVPRRVPRFGKFKLF